MSVSLATIKKVNPEDVKFLNEIIKGGDVSVAIPVDIDPKEWKSSTSIVCRALRRIDLQGQALMPILGRLLVVARDNKEQYYPDVTFREFLADKITSEFGVSVSTCFEAIGFVRLDLPMEAYENISRRNLRLLEKAVGPGEEKNSGTKTLVKKAAEMSEAQFLEHLQSKNLVNPGATYGGSAIKIPCTKKCLGMWTNFIAGPEVHKFVGSDKPHKILEAMIDYCQSEFVAQGAAMIEQSGEQAPDTEAIPEDSTEQVEEALAGD